MPIIKSIGRKDTNFGQLIDYLHREDGAEQDSFTYLHNITGIDAEDMKGMTQAFTKNNEYRKKRKNGVGQYHEVMSFHPEDTAILKKHPEILEDLAQVYLELRAPDALSIARVHTDKEHIHLHFMISPNEVGSHKSIRLTKKKFQALRRTIEEYQLTYYPELQHSYAQAREGKQTKKKASSKTSEVQSGRQDHTIQQMKKRGINLVDKKEMASTVKALIHNTNDFTEIQSNLQEYGADVYYYKGNLQGVKYNGRKYRFSRLLEKGSEQMKWVESFNEKGKKKQRGRDDTLEIEIDLLLLSSKKVF